LVVETINSLLDPLLSVFDIVEGNVNVAAPAGILIFGLVTGLRHSMEADHIAAVLSMLAIKRASLLGAMWGLGHTAALFVAGLLVLLFAINIPENVSSRLEFGVGIMLVFLAIIAFTGWDIGRFFRGLRYNNKSHSHIHQHGSVLHSHDHLHDSGHTHTHKSLIVGMIHGMAGSGALMLVVLSTINSVPLGITYIAIFGTGSIAGMVGTSTLIGIPFAKITSVKVSLLLRYIAAATTLVIGAGLIYDLVWVEQIFIS
jgi:lysylphosphatidylglycerol synthetase-like protein (DUF2156 family)